MNVLVLGAGVQGRVVACALERRDATVRLADLVQFITKILCAQVLASL